MWLPEGLDPKGYTFEVTPPRGITCDVTPSLALRGDPRFPRGDPRDFVNLRVGGVVVGQMSVDKNRGTRWRAMVALAPSMPVKMPDGEPERWAPSGQWTLKIKRKASADRLPEGGYVNVWVQRDDDPSELRTGGRQGYLVDFDLQKTRTTLFVNTICICWILWFFTHVGSPGCFKMPNGLVWTHPRRYGL